MQNLDINSFRDEFSNLTEGWKWEIKGICDDQDRVLPIDTDTKVISTLFERLSSPVLRSIAKKYGYEVENANQTTYPDFTITKKDANGNVIHRIAIDIKTTYRSKTMLFTLGGYNSFLRNNTKNILYNYDTYNDHWILGFLYTQNPKFEEYNLEELEAKKDSTNIACPYKEVIWFVREKHSISGLRAGSGNTKNIGSIKLKDANLFSTEEGPFTKFSDAKAACDHYWRNYETYKSTIKTEADLLAHEEFRIFRPK